MNFNIFIGAVMLLVLYLGLILPFQLSSHVADFRIECHSMGGEVTKGPDRNGANTGGRSHLCIRGNKIIMQKYITG